MKSKLVIGCVTMVCLTLSACQSSGGAHKAKVVKAATPEQKQALMQPLMALEGTWEMPGEDGKPEATLFKTTSNGSVVREIMFPGSSHEMTNMYHFDGDSLLMTHYCAMGNQPRMRASTNKNGVIEFVSDGVSNLTSSSEEYMAKMTLTIKDKNHIQQQWWSIKDGKVESEHVSFTLTRKQ